MGLKYCSQAGKLISNIYNMSYYKDIVEQGDYVEKVLLKKDVYSEEFLTAFYQMLEKFVNEYDDMSQMTAIQQATALLETFNDM